MTSDEEAPFPYKLTKPCQIVRVTQRRLSQLALTKPILVRRKVIASTFHK